MLTFENKVVVITGASKGIGAGLAAGFAELGASVAVNYNSDSDGADQLVREISERTKSKAIAVQADVGNAQDAERLIHEVLQEYGKVDVLINNAGIAIWKPLLELTEDDWDQTMDTNLKSIFLLSKQVVPSMIEQGGGAILNISSIAARGSMDCLAPYNASKGGMTLLTKALAVELAKYNIRVNALAPGTIDIPRNRKTDPNYPQGESAKSERSWSQHFFYVLDRLLILQEKRYFPMVD